jgi:hypothetical protein
MDRCGAVVKGKTAGRASRRLTGGVSNGFIREEKGNVGGVGGCCKGVRVRVGDRLTGAVIG